MSKKGFIDQAIGTYREASTHLSRQHRLWLALAELEVKRGRPIDAVNALVDGSRRLRSRRNNKRRSRCSSRRARSSPGPSSELRARRRARERRRAGPRPAHPRGARAARARPRAAQAARPPVLSLPDAGSRLALARDGGYTWLSARNRLHPTRRRLRPDPARRDAGDRDDRARRGRRRRRRPRHVRRSVAAAGGARERARADRGADAGRLRHQLPDAVSRSRGGRGRGAPRAGRRVLLWRSRPAPGRARAQRAGRS